MKFLADMGLARSTVAFLRSRGHDAVHLLMSSVASNILA